MRGIIQVAGILDRDEAQMLIEERVQYLGFPFRLPLREEDITEEEAIEIIRSLPPHVSAVLITYLKDADDILDLARLLGVRFVQLHGAIPLSEVKRLKSLDATLRLIKSLVVKSDNFPELSRLVLQLSPCVEAFITDTHDPRTGAEGATGQVHDWLISRRLVEISPRPVILAGGLNPENVRQAISLVRPAGVDVHTGVERPDGRKDRQLVREFVNHAAQAFAAHG